MKTTITYTNGVTYTVSVPRTDLTLREFTQLCRRLATAAGYTEQNIQAEFGELELLDEER